MEYINSTELLQVYLKKIYIYIQTIYRQGTSDIISRLLSGRYLSAMQEQP
jgi:hypothetical protein